MVTTASPRTVTCPSCGRKNRVPAAAPGSPRCGHCRSPLPWIADAGDDDFAVVAEASTLPVVVDLWAQWCGPCGTLSPALEQVAAELAGRVKLVKVDVDAAPRLARRFAVQAVPTLLILRDGAVVTRRSGAAAAGALRHWVDAAL